MPLSFALTIIGAKLLTTATANNATAAVTAYFFKSAIFFYLFAVGCVPRGLCANSGKKLTRLQMRLIRLLPITVT